MFYRPLVDEDHSFKMKQIVGNIYNNSNGSSASFGGSARTGTFRLWISLTAGVNSSDIIDLGNGNTASSKLIYNSMNSLVKKYTGSYRSSASQPSFQLVIFDKQAYNDNVYAPATGSFITSSGSRFVRKSSVVGLSGNEIYNSKSYVPICRQSGDSVGLLFPWQGVYVHYNQSIKLAGNTSVFWYPVSYKQNAFYFCRANSGGFNFSNNVSFNPSSMTRTYITTVGLYGERSSDDLGSSASPLLAVAKINTPVKKNNENEYLFKISLEF